MGRLDLPDKPIGHVTITVEFRDELYHAVDVDLPAARERVAALEAEVAALSAEIKALRAR